MGVPKTLERGDAQAADFKGIEKACCAVQKTHVVGT